MTIPTERREHYKEEIWSEVYIPVRNPFTYTKEIYHPLHFKMGAQCELMSEIIDGCQLLTESMLTSKYFI